jgi:predicted GH43/DUF377 family glycosyl hydrolase
MSVTVRDHGWELEADPDRVITQLFLPGESTAPRRPRAEIIADRVSLLSDAVAAELASNLIDDFSSRHDEIAKIFNEHADSVLARIGESMPSGPHHVVLGATFTSEYSVEGASLCNPSVVLHPDQDGLEAGQARLALSFRQIGEGHVSSIGFGSAVVGPGEKWEFEERKRPLCRPTVTPFGGTWSSYDATFPEYSALSQRVLMPVIEEERNGVEDARMVSFTDNGVTDYRATYTAYDGDAVKPRLLISPDLVSFTSHPLTGAAATNKGVALFPRRIDGELYALVRSDGETNSLAHSPDGRAWGRETAILAPSLPWELVQSGNCGSPLETSEGWLVLTHGVGPMRVYSLGAMLLDLTAPNRVVAVLEEPLLQSSGPRQPGYVPNVVYSCGSILHEDLLWVPLGVGDNRVRVASMNVNELLGAMKRL